MTKKRIIFMGTPGFAVPSLEVLIHSDYKVVAVCAQPDRKAGRGQEVTLSPVKHIALAQGLKIVQPDSLKAEGVVEQLASFAPDLIVVAAFGQIIPAEILDLPKLGCLNVHPSLLPRYRGASPVATAILQGDEVTGVTIMLLDAGIDTGPILSQREMPISADDTTASLTIRLAHAGAHLLTETLPLWIDGQIKPQPQEKSQASYSKIINKSDGEIDWRLTAVELWRKVRAFDPWPGCYTSWKGKRLKLGQVVPLPGEGAGQYGQVIAVSTSAPATVGVRTGDGILGLLKVQMEGKKEMTTDEFIRGQKDFIGSLL